MGSLRFEGVRFVVWSRDHPPPHVHGSYAEVEIFVDLLVEHQSVRLSHRKDAKRPANASQADVKHILDTAAEHFGTLITLWRDAHGESNNVNDRR